jgi:hypothetical protein
MITRRLDGRASCLARQSLERTLERKPRIHLPATCKGGHESGYSEGHCRQQRDLCGANGSEWWWHGLLARRNDFRRRLRSAISQRLRQWTWGPQVADPGINPGEANGWFWLNLNGKTVAYSSQNEVNFGGQFFQEQFDANIFLITYDSQPI